MRKTLWVLGFVGLIVLASSEDAFGTGRSGGGRGGSSGGRGNAGRGNAGRGYGGGGYAGRGYGGGGYGGGGFYGGGLYGGGFYGGGIYEGAGYSNPPIYYNPAPGYPAYSQPVPVVAPTQSRQSYYPNPATAQQFATVKVIVPTADAQVWFENTKTTQIGMERLFESPPLTPNDDYTYTIKARWKEQGKTVNQERHVNVQAGQNITVNFREDSREIATPTEGTSSQK